MNAEWIARHFARIGARAQIRPVAMARFARTPGMTIDIGRDRNGEFFDIAVNRGAIPRLQVLDTQSRLRHLLLMNRESGAPHKFLCGHDERHWFVAAVPEGRSASTVRTAMEALKPAPVQWMQNSVHKVKSKDRNRRRNKAFVRQGEWFFVLVPNRFRVNENLILRNEPLRRGNAKPHICEELVRQGGETVYVSQQHRRGLTPAQHRKLLSQRPDPGRLHWSVQRRNPSVFVRGRVRHADHKTIMLTDWHQVFMNTETQSLAMRHVAFID